VNAAELLREVGLLPDGPVVWGRPVPARAAGIFVVELAEPLPRAPIELTRVGKWVERVPSLTLDGVRPGSRAVAARLGQFWLPSQVVLYVGSTTSIGRRVAALQSTVLGDRRPHSGGHWLHTFRASVPMRVWWAATDAAEEYEDALLNTFAANVPADEIAALHDPSVVLPFANLRRPTGERRATGLAGSLLPEVQEPAPPPTHVVVVPDGDAEGARGEPPDRKARSRGGSRAAGAAGAGARGATGASSAGSSAAGPSAAGPGPTKSAAPDARLTASGAARMRAELTELTDVRRPQVVGRIRAAKELGDLKENADYTAAREEQSFLEGRIQALEARLRGAVIAEVPVVGSGADIGSTVTVEVDGSEVTYTLVGSAESDPGAGRLSAVSPVGRGLVGAKAGDEVMIQTPRGSVTYRVIAVD
jgi:transcription elongation factor GreA